MNCLARNETTIYYATVSGKTELTDEYGNKTGQYELTYSAPVKWAANIRWEEQAKRIIDFLSGTVYAIGGDLQKIGVGIFLCTPKNVNVEGSISEEDGNKKQEDIE